MNFNRPLTLASKSPRRHQLLKDCGFHFDIKKIDVDESFSPEMDVYEVAPFLSRKKADAYNIIGNEVVITADTVVIFDQKILGKPSNSSEAIAMLSALSGEKHEVITGVTIRSKDKTITFDDLTKVTFRNLSLEEIKFYIHNYKPFDKAGSYGAQDWWGLVGIEHLEGSYFNVMGLPTHKVYPQLMTFIE